MTTILVTGGTGTLGRLVAERLRAGGHEVRVLSRHARPYAVDLREGGPGLDEAVAGVDAIVHCASTPRGGDEKAAGHLIEAARRAGVSHLLYISIVGVDRVPLGYYKSKHAVEKLVEESGLGWTVLRTTQFHDLVFQGLQTLARLPVMLLPAGSPTSRSMSPKWPTAWWSWRRAHLRGAWRTWVVPRCVRPRIWRAPTCARAVGAGRSSRCAWPGRRTRACGTVGI